MSLSDLARFPKYFLKHLYPSRACDRYPNTSSHQNQQLNCTTFNRGARCENIVISKLVLELASNQYWMHIKSSGDSFNAFRNRTRCPFVKISAPTPCVVHLTTRDLNCNNFQLIESTFPHSWPGIGTEITVSTIGRSKHEPAKYSQRLK